jgi:hypothetical protein
MQQEDTLALAKQQVITTLHALGTTKLLVVKLLDLFVQEHCQTK